MGKKFVSKATLKRNDWTKETVEAAARQTARGLGYNATQVETFASNTVAKWQRGDATLVTHDFPES